MTDNRPYDEIYDTMMEVAEDPTGAQWAIEVLCADREMLRRRAVKAEIRLADAMNTIRRIRSNIRLEAS